MNPDPRKRRPLEVERGATLKVSPEAGDPGSTTSLKPTEVPVLLCQAVVSASARGGEGQRAGSTGQGGGGWGGSAIHTGWPVFSEFLSMGLFKNL